MPLLVLGANSLIAQAASANFAEAGHEIIFAGRNKEELSKIAGDFNIRYKVNCLTEYFDALDYANHRKFVETVFTISPELNYALIVFGYLGTQEKAQSDFTEAHKIINSNYTGVVSACELIAAEFESRKKGSIAIISSVAGDRGRQSNYMYGSAKAGLSAYSQGLRNRLFKSGVNVLTIKPGFVDTPMTYGMPLPKLLVASPKKVGKDIYKAMIKGKNVIYTPFYWWWIMKIVKSIPETIFKKLKL
ncbi:MAG: SDR family oxidoreductase [Chlorobi bacterium]|nr:SDR family oxidoreductase [Chlorobiota bacterium]MCI0715670.1 SDR family oxidoreductase [Chlorobiota bacterium]